MEGKKKKEKRWRRSEGEKKHSRRRGGKGDGMYFFKP